MKKTLDFGYLVEGVEKEKPSEYSVVAKRN
jgi:hypothetical protein